jgi:hypothetical protein
MKTPTLDESQQAVKAARQTIERHEQPLPADLEQAWAAWSAGVGRVDERARILLRAAFESGYKVGVAASIAHH